MNFQRVFQSPEKQWVDNVPLMLVGFTATKPGKYQKFEQTLTLKDATGDQRTMYLRTDYENGLMSQLEVNQTLNYRVKWYNAKAGPGLQGYCESPVGGGQAPAPTTVPQQNFAPGPVYTPPPSYTPPSQVPPAYVAPQQPVNDVQDNIRFAQALNLANEQYSHEKFNKEDFKANTIMFYELLKTRVFPAWMMPVATGGPAPVDTTDYSQEPNPFG